ncbi:fatty-acid--CoA ligase [Elysia marginata]|uniref:Fatty-acid--CoA ligase n=1 Tax=Elysia marginata TaxID=1093978 RepID=A0AAV4JP64_9GAST|nr:fatty-acid--CoA ligase [Elysia marginata]
MTRRTYNGSWVGGYPFKNYVSGTVRVLVDTISTRGRCGASEILAAVTREKCSTGFIMPLEVEALLDHLTPEEIKRFRLEALITGGQPIKRSHVARALQLAETVLIGYAGSECGLMAVHACQDAQQYEDFCAGKLVNETIIKVVDDKDNECPPGVIGKFLIKGPSVFSGFFNRQLGQDPATSLAFTPDGWYRTDDFGWFQGDGNLYVLGRATDVISRDGIHLYPGWLEAKIIEHREILEAVVLPVPDKVRHHKICAIVKTSLESTMNHVELKDFCHSIFLANTNDDYVPVPDFFMVRFYVLHFLCW